MLTYLWSVSCTVSVCVSTTTLSFCWDCFLQGYWCVLCWDCFLQGYWCVLCSWPHAFACFLTGLHNGSHADQVVSPGLPQPQNSLGVLHPPPAHLTCIISLVLLTLHTRVGTGAGGTGSATKGSHGDYSGHAKGPSCTSCSVVEVLFWT